MRRSVSGFFSKFRARSRRADLDAALTVLEFVAKRIPESNVTRKAGARPSSSTTSTLVSSGSTFSSSFFCLSIFLPMMAPVAPPTAAPMTAPSAVLPAILPMPAPTAAPPPTPIAVPLAVLLAPHPVSRSDAQASAIAITLKFLIILFIVFGVNNMRCITCYERRRKVRRFTDDPGPSGPHETRL